jgi:predicted RNase H-like HicB family nuclease
VVPAALLGPWAGHITVAEGYNGPLPSLDMNALTFNAVFEDAGDGWVYAHVPELPEVHTQGEGLDQARAMAREAIEFVLEDRRERGEPIPAPTGPR